jgi:pimeloyl-ACP methyl ester carboxylesterase
MKILSRCKTALLAGAVLFFVLSSCSSSPFPRNPDPVRPLPRGFQTLTFEGGKAYEFRNANTNRLLIVIGGGCFGSTMDTATVHFVLPLRDRYTILLLEKFDREIGRYYRNVIADRERYTLDNLVDNYYAVITEYLSQNSFDFIVISGVSEGAIILPELYVRLNNPNIKALVSQSGGGGLTYYEQREVFREKSLAEIPPFDVEPMCPACLETLELYAEEPFPNSIDFNMTGGVTFRWLNSVVHRRRFNFYEQINTPMLFMHGELDRNVAVESVKYLQEHLPDHPFDFLFYPDREHTHGTWEMWTRWQNDTSDWLSGIERRFDAERLSRSN